MVILFFIIFMSTVVATPLLSMTYDWSTLVDSDTLLLFQHSKQIGNVYQKTTLDSLKNRIIIEYTIDVSMNDDTTHSLPLVTTSEVRIYNMNGDLTEAMLRIRSETGISEWKVNKNTSNIWIYRIRTGDMEKKIDIRCEIAENLHTWYSLTNALYQKKIKKHQKWSNTLFNLFSGKNDTVIIECLTLPAPDSESDTYVFSVQDVRSNKMTRLKFNHLGDIVFQEVPPWYVAAKNTYYLQTDFTDTSSNTITNSIKIEKDRPENPAETIVLTFTSGMKIHPSVQELYKKSGNRYYKKNTDKISAYWKRTKLKRGEDWLSSTVTIQSSHPEIKLLAHSLKDTMINSWGIIKKITTYVYTSIKKKSVTTFSNAVETLNAGFGDCGEHAVLLTALLRAAGIESNVVLGLVYVPKQQGYVYHAWVAAYDEKNNLIFADPGFGIFPVKHGYIPLVIDSDGTQSVYLFELINSIEITYSPINDHTTH